eukprot:UN05721
MSAMIKKQKNIESESESDCDDEDFDVQPNDLMEQMNTMEQDEQPVFWSLKLVPTEEEFIEHAPLIAGFMINITHACFGSEINENTRTVVMIEAGGNNEAVPICVLNSKKENATLDLLINDIASLKLEGTNVSEVYLTGYLVPGYNDESDVDSHVLPENYFDEYADEDVQEIDDDEFEDQMIN